MTYMENLQDEILSKLDLELKIDDRVQLVNTLLYREDGMMNDLALELVECMDDDECGLLEILADYVLGEYL